MDESRELRIQASIHHFIKTMGWYEDPNFETTAIRFERWISNYQGLSKYECHAKSIEDLARRFPTKNQQLLYVGPTKVFSLCPHHLRLSRPQ